MEDLSRNDLIIALRETMLAIWGKWGEASTPFGKIYKEQDLGWINPDGKSIFISTEYNNAHDGRGQAELEDLFMVQGKLESMVQFLASQDFINKVSGSIATLKKITNALI